MKRMMIALSLVLASLWAAAGIAAEQKYPPMPPVFDIKTDPREALAKYPLGVITRVAAFSHHGKEHRGVALPNGYEGMVYQVGSGTGLRTYTLVFNDKGVVTDVLYNEKGRHNGLTALQLQAQAKRILGPEAEPQPFKKHAPEEYRQGK